MKKFTIFTLTLFLIKVCYSKTKISLIPEDEKIFTLHPAGKQGVNILKRRYDQIKDVILKIIREEGAVTYQYVSDKLVDEIASGFDGKVVWYVVTVKLDLKAGGIIERVPKTSPHKIRLKVSTR
jgi:Family of unknown function (DUF6958)